MDAIMPDLSSYQSAETEWRYSVRVHDAEKAIARARQELAEAEAKLAWLKSHPPLYDLFNWSA